MLFVLSLAVQTLPQSEGERPCKTQNTEQNNGIFKNLEKVQRRATKFILQDYASDYKYRLISLHLLLINMRLDVQDVMFVIMFEGP